MFSIVIPLYNKEHTILRTLYSVLTQTYSEFEVILVDDGSSDDSIALVEKEINDKRLRIISQINKGVSVARNRGVAEAKYPYIAFLDADDEWLPTYLEKVKEAINTFPDAGIYCTPALHRSLVTGNGKYYIVEAYEGQILEIDYFKDPKLLGGQTSGVVVSKMIFNEIQENYEGGGFPAGLSLNEDWACFQSIALVSKAVYIGYSLAIRNTDVKGQLVDLGDDGLDMRLNKTPIYLNITLRNYLKSGKRNKSFERYRIHEVRSIISFFLRKNYGKSYITKFVDSLDPDYAKLIPNFELNMYKRRNRILTFIYIVASKLVFGVRQFAINNRAVIRK